MNPKPYYQRALLPLLMIMVATTACFCSWTPRDACYKTLSEGNPRMNACIEHVSNTCGISSDLASKLRYNDCANAAAESFLSSPPANNTTINCNVFRLTSPLDGMANGNNTFYWDPLPNATGYRIQVLESGVLRGTFDATGTQTNRVVDMGIGSVGEGSMFQIRLQAFNGPNIVCTNDNYLLRGAPVGSPPSNPPNSAVPTATSTYVPPICNYNYECEPGEDPASCPSDCNQG